MTVSQYDHVVPYTDLGGRGYFGFNAALVEYCYVNHYITHTHHAWPSQMHLKVVIRTVKTF